MQVKVDILAKADPSAAAHICCVVTKPEPRFYKPMWTPISAAIDSLKRTTRKVLSVVVKDALPLDSIVVSHMLASVVRKEEVDDLYVYVVNSIVSEIVNDHTKPVTVVNVNSNIGRMTATSPLRVLSIAGRFSRNAFPPEGDLLWVTDEVSPFTVRVEWGAPHPTGNTMKSKELQAVMHADSTIKSVLVGRTGRKGAFYFSTGIFRAKLAQIQGRK